MNRKKLITVIILLFATQLTVYSNENPDKPRTIDFDNRVKKHYGDFHIDLPASWAPDEDVNLSAKNRTLLYNDANKTVNIELGINYSAEVSLEDVNRNIELYRKNIIKGKTKLHLLRSDGYEDATHRAKFFYHLFEDAGVSGFTVTGIISSKSNDKLAVVKLTVSFPAGSPLAGRATEYLKKSTDIVKSFRIEGL
ncbi:MAG TPA: hypothetical protein PLY21_13070 [Spirochaetota bacterium]|mgnify:FL=1|nr:hypothetical protein [Spirochaetota bacterium]